MKLNEALDVCTELCSFIRDFTSTIEITIGDDRYDVDSFMGGAADMITEVAGKAKELSDYIIDTDDTVLAAKVIGMYDEAMKLSKIAMESYIRNSGNERIELFMRNSLAICANIRLLKSRMNDFHTKESSPRVAGEPDLPNKLTNKEALYFEKAIKAGLMEKSGNGYRWLHNRGLKASLGYFLNRIFNPKGTAQIPYSYLETLFGVTRLDTSIDQALNPQKPQKWRKDIDILFDD